MKTSTLLCLAVSSALLIMQGSASVIRPVKGLADLSWEEQIVRALNRPPVSKQNRTLTPRGHSGCEEAYGIAVCPPGELRDEWGCHPKIIEHEDAHHDTILQFVDLFCRKDVPERFNKRPFYFTKIYGDPNDKSNKLSKFPGENADADAADVVTITISEHNCDPLLTSMSVLHPKRGSTLGPGYEGCRNIIYGAWRGCTGNEGQGGWIVSGCLKYDLSLEY